MSLNIFVSQRHVQTLQIETHTTKKKKQQTGMYAEDFCIDSVRNSDQMRLRFDTFLAK